MARSKKKVQSFTDNAKQFGDDMWMMGRKMWLAGLGAASFATDEIRDGFEQMVQRGQKFEKTQNKTVEKTVDRATGWVKDLGNQFEKQVQGGVTNVLHRTGVPSRDEIRTLINRVDALSRKVDGLTPTR